MFIEPKILKHEQTTELVHTLEINGETYEKTSEIKSKIIHDHPKSCKSLFSLTLRHNSKPNVTFKETRIYGTVKGTKHETTLKKNEFNSFIQRYFIAWKPRLTGNSVFKIAGEPSESLEPEEDYEEVLEKMGKEDTDDSSNPALN